MNYLEISEAQRPDLYSIGVNIYFLRMIELTYSRRGIHGELVHDLGTRIVRGELASGSVLDVDELGAEADVSRTVVREVLKVLTAKGLVEARPRRGTHVRDRAHWNVLDPDVLQWQSEVALDPEFIRDVSAVREAIEPIAARAAAEHADEESRRRLSEAFALLEAAAMKDLAVVVEADVEFHGALLAASGNRLFQHMVPLLSMALRGRDALVMDDTVARYPDGLKLAEHQAVLEAILQRKPILAERRMRALMKRSRIDAEAAVEKAIQAASNPESSPGRGVDDHAGV